MSVLISDRKIGIQRRALTYDSHGYPIVGGQESQSDMYPGLARERGDGGWTLSVDEALWPIRQGDILFDDQGNSWVSATADHLRNLIDPLVNYVRVDAHERKPGGSEPGGPEFVGR